MHSVVPQVQLPALGNEPSVMEHMRLELHAFLEERQNNPLDESQTFRPQTHFPVLSVEPSVMEHARFWEHLLLGSMQNIPLVAEHSRLLSHLQSCEFISLPLVFVQGAAKHTRKPLASEPYPDSGSISVLQVIISPTTTTTFIGPASLP